MGISLRIFFSSFILGGLLLSAPPYSSAMEGPDVVELDTLSNIYAAVIFDHAMHTDMVSCATCHHQTTGMEVEDARCARCHKTADQADEVACTGCHATGSESGGMIKKAQSAGLFHTETTGLKRAYHVQCLGCHKEMEAASGCEDCHSRKDGDLKVSQISGN